MRRRDNDEPASGGEAQRPTWLVWLTGVLTEQGYDVTSPRGGGQAKLARETGLAGSTINRILRDAQVPDYDSQRRLARHLGLSLQEFLVRTGKAEPGDFHAEQGFPVGEAETGHWQVSSDMRLTPEEIAALAGVPDEDLNWFTTMVRSMRRHGPSDGGSATGGAAAEG
ncbi:hypothetical protein HEK131_20800 [Streptomyces seoulensis]|nr:hypothetical protein HEK131_20800 [Streptomyces seoulensis]